jgi:hypothetical protein
LAKRYEKIIRDNWNDYLTDANNSTPSKMNANHILSSLKKINVVPSNLILEELKPLLKELVVDYNIKKKYTSPELSKEYRQTIINKN